MNVEYFGSIEGILVIDEDFEVIYFVVNMCFYLYYGRSYEEGQSSQRDEISFEGDVIILILLEVCQLFFDSFAFDLMLKLIVLLDCFDKLGKVQEVHSNNFELCNYIWIWSINKEYLKDRLITTA